MSNMTLQQIALVIHRSLAAISQKNVPAVRPLRREWSKRLRNHPGISVVALAKRLKSLGTWEQLVGYEIIANHQRAIDALTERSVEALGRGIDSWGTVDTFACYVAGPAWRERKIPERVIRRWARSPDRWWRRAALVSTVPLNSRARGGSTDTTRTIKICRILVSDRDDMVVKALSWALRELGKRNRSAVEDFLRTYAELLPARVHREVTNKLHTGLKNPRRSRLG